MSLFDANMSTMMSELSKQIAEAQEREMLAQLNDMIADGILETIETRPVFTKEFNPKTGGYDLKITKAVKVVSKDQSLIDSLRAEVMTLKQKNLALIHQIENSGAMLEAKQKQYEDLKKLMKESTDDKKEEA